MKTERRYRSLELHRAEADAESRTVPLSFSSEEPVDRWFGTEVLAHDAKSIRMDRASRGLPLLIGHNPDALPVGRVESIRLAGKRLRGVARFGDTEAGREAFAAVRDGTAPDVSIGYWVHSMVLEESSESKEVYRVTDWEPLEVSIVAVPADPSVGINRSLEGSKMPEPKIEVTDGPAVAAERNRAFRIRDAAEKFGLVELGERAVSEGWPLATWRERFMAAMEERQSSFRAYTPPAETAIPQRELARFNVLNLVRSMVEMNPREAGLELEICRETARAIGHQGSGLVVPLAAFARRDISATGSALVGTDHVPGAFVDVLAPYARTPNLATMLDGLVGNMSIPRATGSTTGYWVSEDGELTESTPTFDSVTLAPKGLGGLVEVTYLAQKQSTPDVVNLVNADLMRTVGNALDRAALNGGGANEPDGILQTAGIGSVSAGGSTLSWENVAEFIGDLGAANALDGRLAWVTTPGVMAQLLRESKDAGSGAFVWEPAPAGSDANGSIAGIPAYYTSNVPSTLGVGGNLHACILGNWADLIIGSWGAVELAIDTSTHFTRGRVRLRAMLLCDVAVRHAESFAAAIDINPAP